jgi:hypothetical protein
MSSCDNALKRKAGGDALPVRLTAKQRKQEKLRQRFRKAAPLPDGSPCLYTILAEATVDLPQHEFWLSPTTGGLSDSMRDASCGCEIDLMDEGAPELVSQISNVMHCHLKWDVLPSTAERRGCAVAMLALIKHCIGKGYLTQHGCAEVKKEALACRKFDNDRIVNAIERLSEEGYWKGLEKEEEEGTVGGGVSTEDGDDHDVDYNDDHSYEDHIHGDYDSNEFEVRAVRDDGWVFQPEASYQSDVSDETDGLILLRLPSDIACLGHRGMQIKFLPLSLRRGLWHPRTELDFKNKRRIMFHVFPNIRS